MHELSIADSILDAVRNESARHGGAHVSKVGLLLGELAGVDRESLSFCFDALVLGTELEPLELDIEFRQRVDELKLHYVELEEP
jgi:hydrogenase nickel incorporation protein HypA/HybF